MQYRRLARTGLELSALGLGTARPPYDDPAAEAQVRECVGVAFELGINHVDTAESYGDGTAEIHLGRALRSLGRARSDVVVSTKLYNSGTGPNRRGLGRKRIVEGLDASLARLQLSHVDIVYCHRFDDRVALDEVVRAMHAVIERGRALFWGTSNWTPAQVEAAAARASELHLTPPSVEQVVLDPLALPSDAAAWRGAAARADIGLIGAGPLLAGVLTGRYVNGLPGETLLADPRYATLRRELLEGPRAAALAAEAARIAETARALGCTPAQAAISRALRRDEFASVVVGARTPAQLAENTAALAFAGTAP